MILPRDLRVGNRVLLDVTGSGVLSEVTLQALSLSEIITNSIHTYPIPITEKLLIDRCCMADGTVLCTDTPQHSPIFISRKFLPSGGFIFQYSGIKIPLTGLHHLQNIFYFLFGQELEIE